MDRSEYIHKRKGRYMAQTLEEFERLIEPLIGEEPAQEFKALVRRKFNGLATDAVEILTLEDDAMNGYARDIKDRLSPESVPPRPAESRGGTS